jgi:sugar lactone lactonase YvrE
MSFSVFVSGLIEPIGLVFDSFGDLYCSNNSNGTILKITTDGTTTLFASGLSSPNGLAFDSSGNL